MKYMGSKRTMLANGLGELLLRETCSASRFVDLFVGSGAVAWHVAEKTSVEVVAADLQQFATVLAEAIIARTYPAEPKVLWDKWQRRAVKRFYKMELQQDVERFEPFNWMDKPTHFVEKAQKICKRASSPITRAYGGYYFSPKQALQIDALRSTLPKDGDEQALALAALICAASECAAAPGHTAQPFKPTPTAARFLFEAWRRDIFTRTYSALMHLSHRYAKRKGWTVVCDALTLASELKDSDLAFIDPPYSGVHYSRFYHVLETIARGKCSEVSGEGRYPPPNERPKSDFSIQSKSRTALDALLSLLSKRGVRTILTFPKEKTSNGLSGEIVEQVASQYFNINKTETNGRFSTLGGNSRKNYRMARIPAYEIILLMSPK